MTSLVLTMNFNFSKASSKEILNLKLSTTTDTHKEILYCTNVDTYVKASGFKVAFYTLFSSKHFQYFYSIKLK